ncbi:hypothetical protein BDF21DRAFT_114532 [Thamnidium elegans]|nr:hypothetical protein BDF21DRAFT_114532 [Thamnidium elegans]
MVKNVYILETKLNLEKIERLKSMLQYTQEYKVIRAYTFADYIVTELKSPLRIMRMVKKSTCPIIHLNWLLESVPFIRLLNPLDYEIDVSEARKQAIIDLSTHVAVRTLPRQYTWDQIAKKRSNVVSLESTGLQARSQFTRLYGSRIKSVKKHSINKVSVLGTLEQKVLSSASLPPSQGTDSQSNSCSTVTVKEEEPIITSDPTITTNVTLTFKSETTNRAGPSIKNEPSIKNDGVDMNKQAETFSNGGESSKVKQADTNLVSNVDIQDTATLNNGRNSNALQETNKVTSSNKQVDTVHDSGFSIIDTNVILQSSKSLSYSAPETHSFHNSARENQNFSCSNISSMEDFDSKKFSLSYILSL